jgi:hypothetical protein
VVQEVKMVRKTLPLPKKRMKREKEALKTSR